jgi:hypothetical protein
MRILIVSVSYQNYKNGALNYKLTKGLEGQGGVFGWERIS